MKLTYPHELPKLLGRNAYIVYSLLCFAEMEKIAPVGRQWLVDAMPGPASPNTVTQALRLLTSPEYQFAVRVHGGWRIALNAFQLPLGYLLTEKDSESTKDSESLLYCESTKDSLRALGGGAESNAALSTITTTTTTNRGKKDSENPKDSESTFSGRVRACLDLLREHGVVGRKARELAQLEWVTPEYIRGHFELTESEPDRWESPVGMAVYRIQEHMPVSKKRAKPDDDDRSRYFTGKYAEFLAHDDDEEE